MIVKWNGIGIKIIPLTTTGATPTERSKMKSAKGIIVLCPGVNDIPDGDWDIAMIHIKDDILSNRIQIIGKVESIERKFPKNKNARSLKAEGKSFKELEVEEAIEIVNETLNLLTLENWLKEESRESVRVAILEQQVYVEQEMKKGKVTTDGDNVKALDSKGKRKKKTGTKNLFARNPLTFDEEKEAEDIE